MAQGTDSVTSSVEADSLTGYTKYIRTETRLKDMHLVNADGRRLSKRKWLRNALVSVGATDTMNVQCMLDERVVRVTRPRGSRKEYEEVLGINRERMNELFNTGDVMDYFIKRRLKNELVRDTVIRLRKHKVIGQFQIHRTVMYCDSTYEPVPAKKYRWRSHLKYSGTAEMRRSEFWTRYDSLLAKDLRRRYVEDSLNCHSTYYDSTGVSHHVQSAVEQDVCAALDYITLKSGRWMNLLTFPAKSLINNYIELGKKPVFSIEPVSSIFSVNTEDGFRLRMGGKTTANLMKRLFFGGYVAYGFSSKKVYGMAKVLYSFVDKEYEETEFPRRGVSFTYRNDICPLGERKMHTDHDNLFRSYEWDRNTRMMFYNLQKFEFEWDLKNGFGFISGVRREEDSATDKMVFHTLHDIRLDEEAREQGRGSIFTGNGSVCTTELRIELVYIPPTKRFLTRKNISPVNTELPLISFSHDFGVKFLGGGYSYHLSEMKIFKDWYLGNIGVARTMFRAGYLWNRVPFPVLLAPAANVSYISDEESFGLLRKSEFLNDRYVQLNLSLETNGNLVGLIPFVKRLRLKEFVGVRVMFGALSEKNNPGLEMNEDSRILMPLPGGVNVMDGDIPYVEGVVGIHNILHVINLDFVFRFTYLDVPDSSSNGFRFSVHF